MMQTRLEVTKTIWVGFTTEQKQDVLSALIALHRDGLTINDLQEEHAEALNKFRQTLLNE